MRFDELIWNFGHQRHSTACVARPATGEKFVIYFHGESGYDALTPITIIYHLSEASRAELEAFIADCEHDPFWDLEDERREEEARYGTAAWDDIQKSRAVAEKRAAMPAEGDYAEEERLPTGELPLMLHPSREDREHWRKHGLPER